MQRFQIFFKLLGYAKPKVTAGSFNTFVIGLTANKSPPQLNEVVKNQPIIFSWLSYESLKGNIKVIYKPFQPEWKRYKMAISILFIHDFVCFNNNFLRDLWLPYLQYVKKFSLNDFATKMINDPTLKTFSKSLQESSGTMLRMAWNVLSILL